MLTAAFALVALLLAATMARAGGASSECTEESLAEGLASATATVSAGRFRLGVVASIARLG